ncbi:MAG: UDP-N-acetylmuramoyl-L-alanyl-D-glutamate--2,6-diaminopimelate ligase [Planctomycetota bacterium]
MRSATPNAGAIGLRELLPSSQIFGTKDIRVASCCGDSRHCKQGDLFAAMVGISTDGHHFANEAVSKGASAILAERVLPINVPTCIVEDTRQAYGQICHALVGNPTSALNSIGVTGTYGKTTTSMLITSILEAAGGTVGIGTTIGYCDSQDVNLELDTVQPTAPEYVRQIAAMRDNGCSHAVVEMPSRGLARHSFAGTQLDGAVITNVRRNHIPFHGTVMAYRRMKQRILSYLKPGGYAVINVDDPASKFVLGELNHPVLTFGIRNPAEVSARVLEQHQGEQTFLLQAGNESVPVRTKIMGQQHISSCLAAASVALVNGIDLSTIARGLSSVDGLPGRMERIGVHHPLSVYVDRARTSDSLAVTLRTVKQFTEGRVICVFGAAGEGDPAERPLLGRVVERLADVGIITRNNPGIEDPLQIAHDILDGYDRPARGHMIPDRAKAIQWAINEAEPNDTVLIAGRGDEKTEKVDGTVVDFDDRQVVRYFLEELEAGQNLPQRRTA